MPAFSVAEDTGDKYALDEGDYDAVLVAITDYVPDPEKPRNPMFEDKDQWTFTYQLYENGEPLEWEDGTPATKKEWVNKVGALTSQSKLYERFMSLINNDQPLDKSTMYDTDDLLDVPCVIHWGGYIGKDATGKDKRKFKITEVRGRKPKAVTGLRRKGTEAQIDPDAVKF